MRIDQPGKDGRIGQLDAYRIGGSLRLRGRASADDLSVFDHQHLICEQFASLHIEHVPRMHRHVARTSALTTEVPTHRHCKYEHRSANPLHRASLS